MSKPEFVYTAYIETSPEKLWQALTDGDFTERYWFGHRVTSDWKVGSSYRFAKQGAPTIEGKVLVVDPRSGWPIPGTPVRRKPSASAPPASLLILNRAAMSSN